MGVVISILSDTDVVVRLTVAGLCAGVRGDGAPAAAPDLRARQSRRRRPDRPLPLEWLRGRCVRPQLYTGPKTHTATLLLPGCHVGGLTAAVLCRRCCCTCTNTQRRAWTCSLRGRRWECPSSLSSSSSSTSYSSPYWGVHSWDPLDSTALPPCLMGVNPTLKLWQEGGSGNGPPLNLLVLLLTKDSLMKKLWSCRFERSCSFCVKFEFF